MKSTGYSTIAVTRFLFGNPVGTLVGTVAQSSFARA